MVENTTSSNKRIAKNTLMLYIRMLLTMIVGLYTSRVVLATLGVDDYGIFGVVGGVVSMMGFLNASMSGATSRFITFELGKGDMQRVRDTFSSAMIIHIGIALVVILLAETVGLWFLCNKLVIPEDRMEAAQWVYQCSIISAAVGITQSPYTAVIMSREKMDIYAYMELLNVSLKLGIVYLLLIGNFDKLILYALLTLGVSVFMAILYRIYCVRKFEESHFHWEWNREILKPMLNFSGFDLYGNMTSMVVSQGRSFILNIFFGVAINAAAGVATTVQGVIQGFSGNIIQAIRPQIIKAYSVKDMQRVQYLMTQGMSFSLLLLLFITIPFITEIDYILELWLGQEPKFTGIFCQLLLVFNLLKIISNFFVIVIHASGNVKCFFYTGTVSVLQLVVMFILFWQSSLPPQWTFIIMIIWACIDIMLLFYLVKREIKGLNPEAFSISILKILGIVVVSLLPVYFITKYVNTGFLRLIVVGIIYLFSSSILSFIYMLTETEKIRFVAKIKSMFSLINK